jgi:hypothetical protein
MSTLYEADFYTWIQEQARALRDGRFTELDLEHLAEEIEDLGKSEGKALEAQMVRLLAHLLKWSYQPEKRALGHSWDDSIRDARNLIELALEDNPGLAPRLGEFFERSYPRAVRWASRDTGLAAAVFPKDCPWTWEQVIDPEFFPNG